MNKLDWREPALLVTFSAALVAILYGYPAATQALCSDELYSLLTAEHGFSEMIRLLRNYQPWYYDHPPLYFLLLRNALLISDSPLSLRMLSLMFGFASIASWAVIIHRQGFTLIQAAAFAMLLAFHPSFALHSTMVRMYTMVLLEASMAIFILWRMPRAARRDRIALTLALTLVLGSLVYTSYFGLLFAVGVAALGMVWMLRPSWCEAEDWRVGLHVVAGCAGAGILLIPWVPVILKISPREHAFGEVLSPTRAVQVWEIVKSFFRTVPGCLVILLGWMGLFIFGERRIQWTVFAITLIGVPLAILAFAAPRNRIIDARYMFFALPILLSAAGNGWVALGRKLMPSRKWARLAVAIILVIPLLPYHTFAQQRYLKQLPDWWYTARILKENAKPEEIILTGGYLTGEAMIYHLQRLGANPQRDFSWIHYVINLDPFYDYCRNPKVVWYVGVGTPPEEFEAILFRYFPYRVTFKGNRATIPEAEDIEVYAKHPFNLPADPLSPFPEGFVSPFNEPIPLNYEQRKAAASSNLTSNP